MITLIGLMFDEEQFLADVFCLKSFTIKPGAPSWDSTAWEAGRDFQMKYGFLVC
jgi:hypothetical protein